MAEDAEGNRFVGEGDAALDAMSALTQAKQTGEKAATLGKNSVRGAARASLTFAIYLALVVILLGTVFRHSPGGFVATIVSVPIVATALIYSSRLRNPVLTQGVKRLLTRAGTLTGLLGIVTAILLDVASGTSALLWIPWGLVVGIPLAAAGIQILRKARPEVHA